MASCGHTCTRKASQCQRWVDNDQILTSTVGDIRKLAGDSYAQRTSRAEFWPQTGWLIRESQLCRTGQLAPSAGH